MQQRQKIPERMDDPALPAHLHRQALHGLSRINRISGGNRLLWPALRNLAKQHPQTPIRYLDLACGAGDTLVALARLAATENLHIEFAGCDISPTAVNHAHEALAIAGVKANLFVYDCLANPLPRDYDAIGCSLFMHHLTEDEVVALLTSMAEATRHLVLVNDLVRGRMNWLMVWLACRLLSRSEVVHFDGPVSIQAAFTIPELQTLADKAGLHGAMIKGGFPSRCVLSWEKR